MAAGILLKAPDYDQILESRVWQVQHGGGAEEKWTALLKVGLWELKAEFPLPGEIEAGIKRPLGRLGPVAKEDITGSGRRRLRKEIMDHGKGEGRTQKLGLW